jgi:hypothetical protein
MTTTASLPSLSVGEVSIDDLRPDPANPRRIGEDELDALERSLRQFGFVQPVLARREDRTVIGGHQRLVAARRLGLTSVPVTWLDVTVEQARLLGLALNKISGSWDEQLLARLIDDLQAAPAEKTYMRVSGQPDADDATGSPAGARGRTRGHRNTTLSGDTRVDWSEAFALVPSLQVGYVWHAGVHADEVATGLKAIGFEIVAQVIWDKGLFAMGRSWYHWSHEPCWVVRKKGAKVPFRGSRDQATIWRVPSPKMIMGGSAEPRLDHPTQKPLLLFETPIRNHLKAGDPLYEPFCGSGTALIAGERTGTRCYAMEIDPIYVEVALARWERFSGQDAVRLDG